MSTISSISNDSTYSLGERSTTAAVAPTPASKSNGTAVADAEQTDNNVQLSTRAQKIQKLNEEFFPSGPKNIRITPDFVARLQEYGLISAADAESLSPGNSESTSSLEELSLFAERYSSRLEEEDPDSNLITTLNKANSIIDAWESSDPNSMAELNTVLVALTEFNDSPMQETLNYDDQKSMRELELAMNIAQKLNPESNVSQEINSYLNILKQYSS